MEKNINTSPLYLSKDQMENDEEEILEIADSMLSNKTLLMI